MANPNIAKLKKKASDFEQKKQFDRALSLYIQLLEEAGRDLDDADLQLYNRVGDLLQRQGNVTEALAYYEKAVDVYAERGFLNNAIALCNKVLRQSPARTSVYYKLGKISATKGFKSDAKKNFLEYAERMQKSGHTDEAFRALKEFADLCPDQDDIRLMLADWMQKENRKSEAVEQLETLYLKLEQEGRDVEARATIDRMKAIDPSAVPRPSDPVVAQKKNDLIFLDLNSEVHSRTCGRRVGNGGASGRRSRGRRAGRARARRAGADIPPRRRRRALLGSRGAAPRWLRIDGRAKLRRTRRARILAPIAGLEQASDASDESEERDVPTESILTIEADSWSESVEPVPQLSGLESPRVSLSGTHPSLSPLIDLPPMTGEEFRNLSLRRQEATDAETASVRSAHDLALPSDLPRLEGHNPTLDLLRVMGTPVGTPVIPDPLEDDAGAHIDLLSLPPVGDTLGASSSLEWPVTGSPDPVEIGATPPDEGAPDGTAASEGVVAPDGRAATDDAATDDAASDERRATTQRATLRRLADAGRSGTPRTQTLLPCTTGTRTRTATRPSRPNGAMMPWRRTRATPPIASRTRAGRRIAERMTARRGIPLN